MSGWWLGVQSGWAGVQLVLQTPALRRGWAGIALLWCLVWLGIFAVALRYDQDVAQRVLAALPPAPPESSWWSGAWRKALVALAYPLVWLAAWLVALVASFPLLSPVLAWWAERVQRALAGDLTPLGWAALLGELVRGAVRSLLLALAELVSTLAVTVVAGTLAWLLPGVGALLQSALLLGMHLLWRAMLVASFALENNAAPLRTQLALLRREPGFLLGVGLWAAPLCVVVPLAPLGVAAGTAAVLRLHAAGRMVLPRCGPPA